MNEAFKEILIVLIVAVILVLCGCDMHTLWLMF